LGKPANPQVAAANAKGKPAKDKATPAAAAKNKGEHPRKPGGKEEKKDHEKAG
jgi:hypothetical protein